MNARGSVILWGIMLSGVIGVATITAGTYYQSFSRTARVASVRSRQTSLETLVRTMAFQPYAYACGSDNGQSAVADISSCRINTAYFASITRVLVPGADCVGGPGTCGFALTGPTITPTGPTATFQATITYEGREESIRPSDITLTIPTELLQSSRFDCAVVDPTRPVLVGFKANGAPDCRGFRPVAGGAPGAETQPCPQGTYASMVNFDPLTITCTTLNTPDKNIACGAGSAISNVQWDNGTVTSSCAGLPTPPM